jgi:hypothetical protein
MRPVDFGLVALAAVLALPENDPIDALLCRLPALSVTSRADAFVRIAVQQHDVGRLRKRVTHSDESVRALHDQASVSRATYSVAGAV